MTSWRCWRLPCLYLCDALPVPRYILPGAPLTPKMSNTSRATIFLLCMHVPAWWAGVSCPPGTVPNGESTPKVSETWCELESDRSILHGPYRAWYPKHVLGTAETYDRGKITGEATYRWHNGRIQAKGSYRSNARHGVWHFWSDTGADAGSVVYAMGKVVSGKLPTWAEERSH
jgi:hypothetical protein